MATYSSSPTEGTVSATSTASSLTVKTDGHPDMIRIVNKGPNTVYFRTDGTTATSDATGNGDQLQSGESALIFLGGVSSISFVCSSAQTATVFYRIYNV